MTLTPEQIEFERTWFKVAHTEGDLSEAQLSQKMALCDLALIGLQHLGKVPRLKAVSADPSKDPAFMAFYSSYPRREARMDAYKAWLQVNAPLEACLAALKWQRSQDEWNKGKQFIPLPATYLRGRRWEDEPPGWAYRDNAAKKEAHTHKHTKDLGDNGHGFRLMECSCGDRVKIPL